jgi:hypothetical protein
VQEAAFDPSAFATVPASKHPVSSVHRKEAAPSSSCFFATDDCFPAAGGSLERLGGWSLAGYDDAEEGEAAPRAEEEPNQGGARVGHGWAQDPDDDDDHEYGRY